MSNLSFDYSKFDRIDLSDDEDTFHDGLDRNLNIRVNRMTRDQKEEAIDAQKAELEEAGEIEAAEKLEKLRPIHQGNACHVADERTIINQPTRPDRLVQKEEFSTDGYTDFAEKNKEILESFGKADWEESYKILCKHGDLLMEQEVGTTYYMLKALDAEMAGDRTTMEALVHQSQIIAQVRQLAGPAKRPPRDLLPRFFEKFTDDDGRRLFQDGVDRVVKGIIKRAVDKKEEEKKAEENKKLQEEMKAKEARGEVERVSLVDAMYRMDKEKRKGPGGLDPVEVFEGLPIEMQKAFRTGDIGGLQQCAEDMGDEVFGQHLQRCIDAGLWRDG